MLHDDPIFINVRPAGDRSCSVDQRKGPYPLRRRLVWAVPSSEASLFARCLGVRRGSSSRQCTRQVTGHLGPEAGRDQAAGQRLVRLRDARPGNVARPRRVLVAMQSRG